MRQGWSTADNTVRDFQSCLSTPFVSSGKYNMNNNDPLELCSGRGLLTATNSLFSLSVHPQIDGSGLAKCSNRFPRHRRAE